MTLAQPVPETRGVPAAQADRVMAVDVLRGLTLAFMILVNNPGDWEHIFPPLNHAEWNGWTPTDLVFPTFLFLVGMSLVFSIDAARRRGNCRGTITGKLLARTGKLIALDLVLALIPRMHWTTLRFFGVLTRIGLCSLVAGLLLLVLRRPRALLLAVAALLVGYWALLRWVPVPGFGMPGRDVPFMDPVANLPAWLDRSIVAWTQRWLHIGSLYDHVRDPEGLLSTLPAVATTLIGALTAMLMRRADPQALPERMRVNALLACAGAALVFCGELWSLWFPINKNLWTSSYVLLTAGWALLLLGLCSVTVDHDVTVWPRLRHALVWPWLVFGSNAIAAYALSELFVKLMIRWHVRDAAGHMQTAWSLSYGDGFARHGSSEWTSLAFGLTFVAFCFLPNWWLWRRRVFFRL